MEKTLDAFLRYQIEAEEKFEEDRWKKEIELEEKRRNEERRHEVQMMQMIGQMLHPRPYHTTLIMMMEQCNITTCSQQ